MKTETKTGNFSSARGQTFDPAVEFTFTVNLFENVAEFEQKGKQLSLLEQMKVRNAEEVTRQRQAAQNAKLDEMGIEKQDINNNDQLRLKDLVKNLMSSPKYKELGREAAIARAEDVLELTWEGPRE